MPSTLPSGPRFAPICPIRAGEGPAGVASGTSTAGMLSRGHTSTAGGVGSPCAPPRGALTRRIGRADVTPQGGDRPAGRWSVDDSGSHAASVAAGGATGAVPPAQPLAPLPYLPSLRCASVDEAVGSARLGALALVHSRKGPALRLLDEREPDAGELHAGEDDQDEDEQEKEGSEAVVHGYTLPSLRAPGRFSPEVADAAGRGCRRRRRRAEPARPRRSGRRGTSPTAVIRIVLIRGAEAGI